MTDRPPRAPRKPNARPTAPRRARSDDAITGLILAGGLSRRMQGLNRTRSAIDKGLVALGGRAMVRWVLERLRPQVATVVINANRNPERYGQFEHPVVSDVFPDYSGPLAGLHAGLKAVDHGWLLTVPCDAPFLPLDLAARLHEAALQAGQPVAMATCEGRNQPVFALVHHGLLSALELAMQGGERKIDRWFASVGFTSVAFPEMAAFCNLNTPKELDAVNQALLALLARGDPVEALMTDTHPWVLAGLSTEDLIALDSPSRDASSNTESTEERAPSPALSVRIVRDTADRAAGKPMRPIESSTDSGRSIPDAENGSFHSQGLARAQLPVEDAVARMIQSAPPLPPSCIRVPLLQCRGRVLAEPLMPGINVPPQDNSAVDGYAIASADLPPQGSRCFDVIGTALAGKPFDGAVGPGQAVRIMTGAWMPAGTDSVAMQEHVVVTPEPHQVEIPEGLLPGQNRRLRGEDLAIGRAALMPGRILGPADLGLAASLGCTDLGVVRRLRVAILSSGDELLRPGEPVRPGAIHDSNRVTLSALLERMGVEVLDMGLIPDEPAALEKAMLMGAAQADVVISSGGVSVGEADHTRALMARLGSVDFWTIAMRPGRPFAFGTVGGARYFGLPGNPVAVVVTFLFLVEPVLWNLLGATPQARPTVRARSAVPVRKRPGRTEYQRVSLSRDPEFGDWVARPAGNQGSGVLRSISEADGIAVLPHDSGSKLAGERIEVVPFHALF